MIFILGEQASGKSTIAKLIYFFRTMQEEFVDLVFTGQKEDWKSFRKLYIPTLKRKFTNIFGTTKELGTFEIKYVFAPDIYVTVVPSKDRFFLNIQMSDSMNKQLRELWDRIYNIIPINKENTYNTYPNISELNLLRDNVLNNLHLLFNDDKEIVYIPAGRAFLSHQPLLQLIQADEMKRYNNSPNYSPYDLLDAATRDYNVKVSRARSLFINREIDRMLLDRKDKVGSSKAAILQFISNTSHSILKGDYLAEKYNEFIIVQDKKIPLSYASSGQQEVVWILNLLYAYALDERKCLIIIEEPETHLHPEAQYLLAKYIAAFRNMTRSEIIITTHSPYILSSFNNLFYADKCGKNVSNANRISSVIPRQSWLNEHEFSSYILDNGCNRDIKDNDLAMIDLAELDAVASVQDSEYEKILAISQEKTK